MKRNKVSYYSKLLSLLLAFVLFSNFPINANAYTKAIRVKTSQDAAAYSNALSYQPVAVQSTNRKQSIIDCTNTLSPTGGVTISTRFGTVTRLESNTYNAWVAMRTAAYYDGVDISISFAYRSVADQQRLYDDYISGRSSVPAAKPPGPHQTGRAIDIFLGVEGIENMSPAAQQKLDAYIWLYDNASKFGFYGYSKTNPNFEGWHWVYNP